jgi:hypothetical protein
MDYKTMIDSIMPLVNEGNSDLPFILSRSGGKWEIDYINLPAEEIEDYFDSVREEKDNCALMYTGADFSKGSLPYVYDKILKERLVLENDNWLVIDDAVAQFIDDIDENIAELSPEAAEYIANLDHPLEWIISVCPPPLIQQIENKVAEATNPIPEVSTEKNKRNIDGYLELNSFNISGRVVILAEKTGADEPYLVCEGRWDNPLGVTEYYNAIVTDDYLEAVGEFVRRETGLLDFLNHERTRSGLSFQTLTAADCVSGGLNENIEGKVIIIKPEALAREFRSAEHMLKICHGGNGSRPEARGNAVFCENLYDGKQSRFERYDILGVADLSKIPEWAREKLTLIETLKEPGVFEYGGQHFKPVRKFVKGEIDKHLDGDSRPDKMDAQYAMRSMGELLKLPGKYSHADFYAKSGDSDADIFKCVETGNLFVPCANGLRIYNEPPQKEHQKANPQYKKSPTLLGELRETTALVEQRKAERGKAPANKTKKRGDLEV